MRDITQVIDKIITVTPKDESAFIIELKALKESCMYTAPEDMTRRWDMLGNIFNHYIPYPSTHEWHDIAIKIFTDKE
jgi:hypothetical protein